MSCLHSVRWVAAGAFALAGASSLTSSACATSDEQRMDTGEGDGVTLPPPEAGEPDGAPDTGGEPAVVRCNPGDLCARAVAVPVRVDDHLTGLWGASPTDIWAIGSLSTVLHSDGESWVRVPVARESKDRMLGIWAGNANDIWIIHGTQLLHTDGWKGADTKLEASGLLVTREPPLVISGWQGKPLTFRRRLIVQQSSVDQWEPWTEGQPASFATLLSFPYAGSYSPLSMATSENDIWVVGQGGITFRLGQSIPDGGGAATDAGAWKAFQYDTLTTGNLYGVWTTEGETWVVGDQGVRRFTAELGHFDPVAVPTTESLHGIFAFSPSDLWVVGTNGCILHYDGTSFQRIASPTQAALHAVWGVAPDDVWIVGEGTSLHVTREP